MKDLIQQAAEQSVDEGVYASVVINFLSYAKENGYELLRVEGDAKAIYAETWKDADSHELIENINIKACANALALGAAKELERMKGVFERACQENTGYGYDKKRELWYSNYEDGAKTTDELINHYENKEG